MMSTFNTCVFILFTKIMLLVVFVQCDIDTFTEEKT